MSEITTPTKLELRKWDDGKRKPPIYTENGWFTENGKTYCFAAPCSACPRESRCEKEDAILQWNKSETVNIRHAIQAREGYVILAIDFRAIEIRIAANEAKEQVWIDALKSGRDLHTEMAALAFKKARDKITKKERTIAKTLNFGNMYGGSAGTLSRQAGIPFNEAEVIWNAWWAAVPNMKGWTLLQAERAIRDGFVTTKFGRRRKLQGIMNEIAKAEEAGDRREANSLRGFLGRTASNTPIQGGAADVMKIAMWRCHSGIKKEKLENDLRMLLTVHDELVFEAREKNYVELANFAASRMVFPVANWPIPMEVDIEYGPDWGTLETLEQKKAEPKPAEASAKQEITENYCTVKVNTTLTVGVAQLLEQVIAESPGKEDLRIVVDGKVFGTKMNVKVSSAEVARKLSEYPSLRVENGKVG